MLVHPLEVSQSIFVLLSVFFGWLSEFLIAFDLNYKDKTAHFDEEVGVELAAFGVLTFLPRIINLVKAVRMRAPRRLSKHETHAIAVVHGAAHLPAKKRSPLSGF